MVTPFYVLAAAPATATRLRGFMREGSDSPGWLLTQPPVVRSSGFDTSTGDIARLVGGERWEAQNGDRKLLRLYQDGSLLFRIRADDAFLAWALEYRAHYGQPTLNPVAVVESHLSFVYLLGALAPWFKERPAEFRISLRFSDARIREQLIAITKYVDPKSGWMPNPDLHPIHSPNAEDSIDVDVLTLIEAPEVAAYSLLTKFYDLFDAGPELIPFTKKSEKGPAVDAEALKRL